MKTHFVGTIKEGETFDSVFIVDSISTKEKKDGNVFWILGLKDKGGLIEGKVWDASSFTEGPPCAGEFIKVRAEASMYKGKLGLTLRKVRRLDPTRQDDALEFTYDDFVPVGPLNRFLLIEDLRMVFEKTVTHPGLHAVCQHVFTDPELHMCLRDAPAAGTIHQPYIGGLLEHVSNQCALTLAVVQGVYGYDTLTYDLLMSACLLHDIGKIRELKWSTGIGYTDEGSLIGHVAISLEMVDRMRLVYWDAVGREHEREVAEIAEIDYSVPAIDWKAKHERNANIWMHLRHIIASHHGQKDWGACKEPASREANLFHLIDMMESRMGMFDQIDQKETFDAEGFTPWNARLNGRAWRMPV